MNYAKTIIYIADDDADDRYFLRQSLQQVYPAVVVVEAQDGSELLTLLDSWSQHSTPHPVQMILLDWNMPKLNGLEALMAIKANPLLCHIPAVMLSTSSEPTQLAMAYQSGASGYWEKPASYAHLTQLVRSIGNVLRDVVGD